MIILDNDPNRITLRNEYGTIIEIHDEDDKGFIVRSFNHKLVVMPQAANAIEIRTVKD